MVDFVLQVMIHHGEKTGQELKGQEPGAEAPGDAASWLTLWLMLSFCCLLVAQDH